MSHASTMLVLLTLISATPLMSVGWQRAGVVLQFYRPLWLTNPNHVIMKCKDSFYATLVLNALFFRNGLRYNAMVSLMGVSFVVDRSSEGNFTCGDERIRSPPVTIVGE
jgi:hypothetical protein